MERLCSILCDDTADGVLRLQTKTSVKDDTSQVFTGVEKGNYWLLHMSDHGPSIHTMGYRVALYEGHGDCCYCGEDQQD